MNAAYIALQDQLNRQVPDVFSRTRVLAAAVALALGAKFEVPSSVVQNATEYYATQHQTVARQKLSYFNESIVFDLTFAEELTRAFWLLRYNTVHFMNVGLVHYPLGFFDTIMGVQQVFDQKMHETLNEHKDAVLFLSKLARDLVCGDEVQPVNNGVVAA